MIKNNVPDSQKRDCVECRRLEKTVWSQNWKYLAYNFGNK